MKIIIAAIAFTIAVPAVAQTAPAQQAQHQGHDQHQDHGQPQQQPGQPQGHPMGDCCADRNGNGRMDCCENMAAPAPAQPQGHDGRV